MKKIDEKIAIEELKKKKKKFNIFKLTYKLKISKHKISKIFTFLKYTEKVLIRKADRTKIIFLNEK